MTIHIDITGNGPPVVLIHGWGLHGGVWARTAQALAGSHEVWRVDLPGFGASAPLAGRYTAQTLAEAVAARVPAGAVWAGWSLGGLVVLAAAHMGASVSRLVLVGATPRFVQAPDWPHAMAGEVLAGFAAELAADWRATVLRFLALQARGSERAREELRALRETVFARGEPATAALSGGLDVLRDTDLRAALGHVTLPALVIHGSRDVLVPVQAAVETTAALHRARLALIEGAGHAPFLSHPDAFERELLAFLHD
ncbi:MAG: pimeloyl-ACP methyl ester esterase BioH [Thiohalomonadaceae bacterium]